jgi:hypothetical protein
MALPDPQLTQLAESLLTALLQRGGATLLAERSKALQCVMSVIRHSEAEEQALDREARKLLDAHLAQAPVGVDQQKLLLMIKRKLADAKGIPL